jgi:hypothetical protein
MGQSEWYEDGENKRKDSGTPHSSGDPAQPGGYSVTFNEIIDVGGKGTEFNLPLSGEYEGKQFSGSLTVHVQNGAFSGWDWNDAGDFDISTDPEGALQAVLDAAANELGLGEGQEDPGPPSEPGSPYDTLEEKRGEK